MNENDLFCVSCGRDFELPRRHMLFIGDHDFSPIPRLLPCLHTLCHSCIEEQYEKEDAHIVSCPQCSHQEPIKFVDLLPLDFSTMKEVVASNNTELLAWCAKCHDPVASVSWCESCSSALCEFHHQDHKLSAETSRHMVATFKEYLEQGKHIEFKFPPISCPQCPLQDCSLYCNSCLHLISPKAFIDFHKDHRITDYEETIPEMVTAVEDSVDISSDNHMMIGSKVRIIRERLKTLEESETLNARRITDTFNIIREVLKKREKEMLQNLSRTINYNREKLKGYMQELIVLDSKIQRVTNCGSALLNDAKKSDDITEKMYLVAAADAIEYRADFLNEELANLISQVDSLRDPDCNVSFLEEDIRVINGIVDRLGSMETGLEEKESIIFAPENPQENELINANILTEEEKRMAEDFNIYFTVKLRDQPPSRMSTLRASNARSASVVHGIVIEARLCKRLQQTKRKDIKIDEAVEQENLNSSSGRGVLLGQIEVLERVNREILSSYKIKSFFETVKRGDNSVLKVTKEFVPAS